MDNKDSIQSLVTQMKEDGYNFTENPAVFKWSYEDHPGLNLTLMIQGDPIEVQPTDLSVTH